MFDCAVIRSARKTVAIEVKNGAVTVRAPRRMSDGEIAVFVQKHSKWVEKQLKNHPIRLEPSEAEKAEYMEKAKKYLPARVEYFINLTGLRPRHLSITGAKTRFGSCSSQGRVCLSWRLMLYPPEAIDYVIVHELCHLRQMNHSAKFYAEIEKILPDYKARRELLR